MAKRQCVKNKACFVLLKLRVSERDRNSNSFLEREKERERRKLLVLGEPCISSAI